MNELSAKLRSQDPDARLGQIVKLAVMAVGGQGGGVLTNWITDLAERNGYRVQATSVAGVAQRTGATIYYVEMLPDTGRQPVFALAPAEGDVDILIAAEMMEAGRAIMRGFVTPGRTTLIASTHRNLATVEKIVPGSGIGDAETVKKAAAEVAKEFIAFDMERIALDSGTVISAALFGALAGSGTLPFDAESYRETIRASGRGVEASLRAFEAAREAAERRATDPAPAPSGKAPAPQVRGPAKLMAKWQALENRVAVLPDPVQALAVPGLKKVVAFQDVAYGAEYLDRIEAAMRAEEQATGGGDWPFTAQAAKYVANAMAYDDIIRVADHKTQAARMPRIGAEVGATDATLVQVTEYVHPGAAEFVSLMPAGVGRWASARPGVMKTIDRMVNRGRRIRTDGIMGFTMLYLAAGLRPWRRRLLRHRQEMAHLENWLSAATARLRSDPALAAETLRVRRLVKGYSDTHARGLSKFDKVMSGTLLVEGREDAADWARRLIDAALQDPEGKALDGALDTIRSFATAGRA
ncbi:MAG: indolepyruvate oxidoreductase subunit beta family protein [Paracoccaceae bacterium]